MPKSPRINISQRIFCDTMKRTYLQNHYTSPSKCMWSILSAITRAGGFSMLLKWTSSGSWPVCATCQYECHRTLTHWYRNGYVMMNHSLSSSTQAMCKQLVNKWMSIYAHTHRLHIKYSGITVMSPPGIWSLRSKVSLDLSAPFFNAFSSSFS